jgi:hypothetical protein
MGIEWFVRVFEIWAFGAEWEEERKIPLGLF